MGVSSFVVFGWDRQKGNELQRNMLPHFHRSRDQFFLENEISRSVE